MVIYTENVTFGQHFLIACIWDFNKVLDVRNFIFTKGFRLLETLCNTLQTRFIKCLIVNKVLRLSFPRKASSEGRTFVINFVDNLGKPGLGKAETLESLGKNSFYYTKMKPLIISEF